MKFFCGVAALYSTLNYKGTIFHVPVFSASCHVPIKENVTTLEDLSKSSVPLVSSPNLMECFCGLLGPRPRGRMGQNFGSLWKDNGGHGGVLSPSPLSLASQSQNSNRLQVPTTSLPPLPLEGSVEFHPSRTSDVLSVSHSSAFLLCNNYHPSTLHSPTCLHPVCTLL